MNAHLHDRFRDFLQFSQLRTNQGLNIMNGIFFLAPEKNKKETQIYTQRNVYSKISRNYRKMQQLTGKQGRKILKRNHLFLKGGKFQIYH